MIDAPAPPPNIGLILFIKPVPFKIKAEAMITAAQIRAIEMIAIPPVLLFCFSVFMRIIPQIFAFALAVVLSQI